MMTWSRRRLYGLLVALVLLLGMVSQASAHESPAPAVADSSTPGPTAGADVGEVYPNWWRGDDVLITGRGQSDGYTVFIALEREKYVLRPLATIKPAGYGADDWLGYTCLTGDRRYAVATVLPRWAVNRPALRDRGALAYVVSTATGAVSPLANEVAFKYHATNCGAGSKVALLRHLGTDQESTEILVADAATRRVTSMGIVRGQLTSPVPDGDGALALGRGGILSVRPGAVVERRAAAPPGIAYRLVARGSAQALAVLNDDTVTAYAVTGAKVNPVASGSKATSFLYASASETPLVVGMDPLAGQFAKTKGLAAPRLYASDGQGLTDRTLTPEAVSAEGKVELATTTTERAGSAPVNAAGETGQTAAIAPAQDKRLFTTTTGRLLYGVLPDDPAASTTTAVPRTTTAMKTAGNFTTPKCSVPRNDPTRTAYGAVPGQVTWAVEQASRNSLPGRPADYLKSGLPAYNPSSDFTVPVIKPSGGNVPPALFNGVLAQESAYRQASRRTLPGSGGNSVISDYYGAGGTIDVIDYTQADCGYGISQVTSGMAAADTSITANGKAKIAIDYAENITAGMNILVKKWNQLQDAGIKLNNSDPSKIENWYLALWAYNTGVQPDARYGNTTGCMPSPTCTDQYGNWGLGWTNNPRNTDYPPTRNVFLRSTYADAEHPADWPYQERVIGWSQVPIKNTKGENAYPPAVRGTLYPYPGINTFCTASSSCNPTTTEGCTRADWRCWWHEPVTFRTCVAASDCTTSGFTTSAGAAEPPAVNPWTPACSSDLGSGAVIVDELPDPSKNIFCPGRNWTTKGTFSYTLGTTAEGAPVSVIDFHQLSTGFGAHAFFAGNRLTADTSHRITGRWKPTNLPPGPYVVKAHIPRAGASAGSAVYRVKAADGAFHDKVINQHEHFNHWKTLGAFQLNAGAEVQLSNVTRDDGSSNAGTVAWDAVAFVPAPGTVVEETIGAYGYFDPNQNLETDWPTTWVAGPFTGAQAFYEWASQHGSELSVNGGTQTRAVGTKLLSDAVAVHNSPSADDDGISQATVLGLSNQLNLRPTGITKPSWFDTEADAYKIRTVATISYVRDPQGQIVEGSADVDYSHRSGNTYLPKFMPDFFAAVQADYGVVKPDLTYSTTNLNHFDHQVKLVPGNSGYLPARSYKDAGRAPALTDENGSPGGRSCVSGLYVSGAVDGFRPMLGVDYVSSRVEAWRDQIRSRSDIPESVKSMAGAIYDVFFDRGNLTDTAPVGSIFNDAPPIWEELNFSVCGNGKIVIGVDPVLRASWMTGHYLYRNGQAINVDATPRYSSSPPLVGDFLRFSRVPNGGTGWWDTPFGGCDWNTGRSGNPWDLTTSYAVGINPDVAHFCANRSLGVDPDAGG